MKVRLSYADYDKYAACPIPGHVYLACHQVYPEDNPTLPSPITNHHLDSKPNPYPLITLTPDSRSPNPIAN